MAGEDQVIMTEGNRFAPALDELTKASSDIKGCLLASLDGLVIAHSPLTNDDMETNKLAAMSSALLGIGRKTLTTLKSGELQEIIIKDKNKLMLIFNAGEELSLLVITDKDASLGFVLMEARKKVKELASIQ